MVFRGERVSYGKLQARVDTFALGLIALGPLRAPKGCLLSHGTVYYECCVYVTLHGWTAADRYKQRAHVIDKYRLRAPA